MLSQQVPITQNQQICQLVIYFLLQDGIICCFAYVYKRDQRKDFEQSFVLYISLFYLSKAAFYFFTCVVIVFALSGLIPVDKITSMNDLLAFVCIVLDVLIPSYVVVHKLMQSICNICANRLCLDFKNVQRWSTAFLIILFTAQAVIEGIIIGAITSVEQDSKRRKYLNECIQIVTEICSSGITFVVILTECGLFCHYNRRAQKNGAQQQHNENYHRFVDRQENAKECLQNGVACLAGLLVFLALDISGYCCYDDDSNNSWGFWLIKDALLIVAQFCFCLVFIIPKKLINDPLLEW